MPPQPDERTLNEEKLLAFLNGLTPTAFGQILLNLPETTGYIPENKSHREQVTALILHMRSSEVKDGMKRLVEVILQLHPDADIFDGSVMGGTTRLP